MNEFETILTFLFGVGVGAWATFDLVAYRVAHSHDRDEASSMTDAAHRIELAARHTEMELQRLAQQRTPYGAGRKRAR